MLLQRLVEYADEGGNSMPPYYARKPVRWLLDLDADGTPLGEFTDTADKGDPTCRFGAAREVPAITRTVAIAPVLAVDNGEYVFGWRGDSDRPERIEKQYQAYRELISRWAAAEPAGPAPTIAKFYESGHDRQIAPPEGWTRADLIGVRVAGQLAAEHLTAQRFWADIAGERKGSGLEGLCLVCGRLRQLLKTIPQQIPQRWLPGATQGASLVSVNEATHGYELQKFLVNTPICTDCGLKIMTALTDLLSSPRHSTTLSGQNARLAWWVLGGSTFDPWGALDQPDAATVRALLAGPARGTDATVDDISTYCSVTVGGNVARVVVRDWVEQPLSKIKANIADWYRDYQMVDHWTGELAHARLTQLSRAAGRWQSGRNGATGTWTKFGASGEDRPAGLLHGLLGAALLGRPLPPKLLGHVISRIQTDGRLDAARASLIRLGLRRYPYLPADVRERLTPALNTQNSNRAFVSGRIFAVMDDLQRAVSRAADQNLNTTFADRYFSRAIANPGAVLVSGQRSVNVWLKRLRGPLRRPGWSEAYKRRLDDLFVQLGDEMPGAVTLPDKGQFILGFHQQRAALRAERTAAAAQKAKTDLPPEPEVAAPSVEGDEA